MKLLHIKVENYRAHRSVEVDLDSLRVLIGGPNEVGKSTLLEAAHRALFLKAKVGGQVQEQMRSLHGGEPRVTLEFELGGRSFRVEKVFAGNNNRSTHTLHDLSDGSLWHDSAADEQLAALLGATTIDGRGAESALQQRWAHLWVRQGSAALDPTAALNADADAVQRLIARLQAQGGAALVIGELDHQIHDACNERAEGLVSGKGWRVRSAVAQAEAAAERAAERLVTARQHVVVLQGLQDSLVQAEAEIRRQQESLAKTVRELEVTEQRNAVAVAIVAEIKESTAALAELNTKARLVAEQLAQRQALQQTLTVAQAGLQALALNKQQAEADLAAQEQRLEQLREQVTVVSAEHEQARARMDVAQGWLDLLHLRNRVARLRQAEQRLEQTQQEVTTLMHEQAALPVIKPKQLRALQETRESLLQARGALEALALKVELLAGSDVRVDDAELAVGAVLRVDQAVELAVGAAVRLRLTPGGDTDLAARRHEIETLEREWRGLLQACRADDLPAAQQMFERRRAIAQILTERKASIEEQQTTLAAEGLEARVAELAALEALAQSGALTGPDETHAAEAALRALKHAEKAASGQVQDVMGQLKAAETIGRELRDAYQQTATRFQVAEAELRDQQTQLRTLTETQGSAETLAATQRDWQQQILRREALLAQQRERLQGDDPEQLAREIQRLMRVQQNAQETLERNRTERARCLALLERDLGGENDLYELLARAEADAATANARKAIEQREARATLLLAQLLREQKQRITEQLGAPLQQSVVRYLSVLFPGQVECTLELSHDGFAGSLQLYRPQRVGQRLPFQSLSMGAQEQVAAALRLAVAELLAAEQGETVPVVFDDAFANSDPDRVRRVQAMLDLAAESGVQVIVLACNPEDYAGLGAKTHWLTSAPAPTGAVTAG